MSQIPLADYGTFPLGFAASQPEGLEKSNDGAMKMLIQREEQCSVVIYRVGIGICKNSLFALSTYITRMVIP